jgi:hypothetical protein
MQVRLAVVGDDTTVAMRSLEAWLTGHQELCGRVRPVVMASRPGTMGAVAEVLMVAVQGGLATAVASVLISWLRRQAGKVSVSATRPDGARITLDAKYVRGVTAEEVGALVTQLAATLDGTGAPLARK